MCLRKSNSRLAGSCLKGLRTPVALLLFILIVWFRQPHGDWSIERRYQRDMITCTSILLSVQATTSEFFLKSLTLFVYSSPV